MKKTFRFTRGWPFPNSEVAHDFGKDLAMNGVPHLVEHLQVKRKSVWYVLVPVQYFMSAEAVLVPFIDQNGLDEGLQVEIIGYIRREYNGSTVKPTKDDRDYVKELAEENDIHVDEVA